MINKELEQSIYTNAISLWGNIAQHVMMMEECAELTKELSKEIRGKGNREKIAEEIADVEIMTSQEKEIHAIHALVEEKKQEKLVRLKVLLESQGVRF